MNSEEPRIVFETRPNGGRFSLTIENDEVGYVTFFFPTEDTLDIDHTVVKTGFEGRGYGRILVTEVKDMAEKNNWKIVPSCSYAAHILKE